MYFAPSALLFIFFFSALAFADYPGYVIPLFVYDKIQDTIYALDSNGENKRILVPKTPELNTNLAWNPNLKKLFASDGKNYTYIWDTDSPDPRQAQVDQSEHSLEVLVVTSLVGFGLISGMQDHYNVLAFLDLKKNSISNITVLSNQSKICHLISGKGWSFYFASVDKTKIFEIGKVIINRLGDKFNLTFRHWNRYDDGSQVWGIAYQDNKLYVSVFNNKTGGRIDVWENENYVETLISDLNKGVPMSVSSMTKSLFLGVNGILKKSAWDSALTFEELGYFADITSLVSAGNQQSAVLQYCVWFLFAFVFAFLK